MFEDISTGIPCVVCGHEIVARGRMISAHIKEAHGFLCSECGLSYKELPRTRTPVTKKLTSQHDMIEPSDQAISRAVRASVRNVISGAKSSGDSMKIDDVWVVVSVQKSLVQDRGGT